MKVSESSQRVRTAKARRQNARAKEASLLVAKHALDRGVLTLGDSAIATLVKGCAGLFAVHPTKPILARHPERQVSCTDRRALVTKLCRESRQTMMSNQLLSNVSNMTS